MKLFLDTNVVVDFCAHREPFFHAAAQIIDLARANEVELIISSLTFVNVAYIVRKAFGKERVLDTLRRLSELCKISKIDEDVIKSAIAMKSKDFEDCVQYLSAHATEADLIITRNKNDFAPFSLPVMTAEEFIEACESRL